jgi:hypothetical protein
MTRSAFFLVLRMIAGEMQATAFRRLQRYGVKKITGAKKVAGCIGHLFKMRYYL